MGGGDLSKGSDFAPTGWTCATNYQGTPAPIVCTTAGGEYTLTECEPACTRPTNTAYDFSSEDADCIHPSSAPTGYTKGTMGGDLSKGSDFAPTGCTSAGGAYTLQGCEADCIHPSSAPTGYTKGTMG